MNGMSKSVWAKNKKKKKYNITIITTIINIKKKTM